MKHSMLARSRSLALGVAALSATLVFAGCASPEQAQSSSGGTGDNNAYQAAVAEAKKITNGQQLASSLEMIGYNAGAEGQTLEQVYRAFTEATDVKIKYTGSQDNVNIVQSRVQSGNPPDVADLPLGVAKGYARQGKLVDLSAAFGNELSQDFSSSMLSYASENGKAFGIPQGLNTYMIWYNPQHYSGPKDPTDWKQITDWTSSEAAKAHRSGVRRRTPAPRPGSRHRPSSRTCS